MVVAGVRAAIIFETSWIMDGTIGQSGLYAPPKNNELPDLYAYYGVLTKLVTISRILEILLIFV